MEGRKMKTNVMPRAITVMILCIILLASSAYAQSVVSFNPSPLVKLGDSAKYGSYVIYKIGEGIYKINDPGTATAVKGGKGVDMYLICGEKKALMVDVGNNYIDGYEKDLIAPRKNAAEELRAIVSKLAGKLPLEVTVTHMHPDHDGMTGAFLNQKLTFWAGEGEDLAGLKIQHGNLDPSIYQVFKQGQKSFDLGGGRMVDTFLLRGHSNGGTVYILKKDRVLLTGDALGFGVGISFASGVPLKNFTEDSQKLVDYILANFSLYERSALRVYTGHSSLDVRGGYSGPNLDNVDGGYLDWRFIQNMRSCANAIAKGLWLVEGSGLRYVKRQPNSNSSPSATMVYGIGSITIPIEVAYETAGLKMPN
jgi:glyoxylase-like metal-dependent hydrolase (beta-lactamase superfamily II)